MARGAQPPAVLLGGESNAVVAARSLARAGVRVWACGASSDPARHSRRVHAFVDLGSGEGVQERWLEWLALREAPDAVLLPCTDDAVELIARNRGSLTAMGYRPAELNDPLALDLLDKERTYALAHEHGIAAPATRTLRVEADAERAARDIGFPLAVKPLHSHVYRRTYGLLSKAIVVDDAARLAAVAADLRARSLAALATEIVPGGDDLLWGYTSYFDEHGRPLFHSTQRKLRQYPPRFGIGCYVGADWDAEVAELGAGLFAALGLRGLAKVEFKRDPREDGRLKLIECNYRLVNAYRVVELAGVPAALIAYRRLTGEPLPPVGPYDASAGLWFPRQDFRSLRARRDDLTVSEWANSLRRRPTPPLWSPDDPLPSMVAGARLARRGAVKLLSGRSAA